jgi:plastocyanin
MRFSWARTSLILLILGAAPASQGTTFTVQIAPGGSLVFSPTSQTINVGDTVHWVWAASGHSTTSGNACTASGLWDSGVQSTGFTFDVTFPTAGTFNYFCSVHCGLGMTGTIIVNPPSTPTPTTPATPTPTPGGPPPPTATPGPGGGPAIPALSPPLLTVLGVLLAIAALLLLRRH